MARSRAAIAAGILALAIAAIIAPALAHEGHGATAGPTFDPNAPKRVSPETAVAIGLETMEVDFGEVENILRLTGVVRSLPGRVQAVAPRIAGTVRTIRVRAGDVVRIGDIVAEVDSPESLRLTSDLVIARSRAEQAAALMETAREREMLARGELDRVEANAQAVSQNMLSEKKTRSVEARGEVRRLEAELAQATREADARQRVIEALGATETGTLPLTAAIDGVVVAQSAVVGQGVEAGQSISQIVDLSRVQIAGEVPESLLPRLASAQDAVVRIRTVSGDAIIGAGTVRVISPVIDATKRTGHLIVDAENASGVLREGQFVELSVVLGINDMAVVAPVSAIVRDGPVQFVFVKEGDTFRKQDVATGIRDDRIVEITQGLVPGDVVVTTGAFSLSQLKGEAPAGAAPPDTASDGHGHSHN